MIEVTPDLVKKIQQKDLEILDEVARVCSLLNITYMLSSGTALGAIRHRGFIPWDDDIDIMMPRVDYDRFMREAPEVIDSNFFVQSYLSEPKHPSFYMKVRANGTVMRERSYASADRHLGVFIDVFPLDRVPDGHFVRRLETLAYHYFDALRHMTTWRICCRKAHPVRRILRCSLYPLARLIGLRRINRWEDRFRGRNRNNQSAASTAADCLVGRYGTYFDWSLFSRTILVPFEGRHFPIMIGYDAYLIRLYGDYMTPPPEDMRKSRHQLEELSL